MKVDVKFFGPFRDDVGVEAETRETDADTVGGLLREIEAEYPVLEGRLVDDDAGTTAGQTAATLNTKNVKHLEGLETALDEGDVLRLVPSVYGG